MTYHNGRRVYRTAHGPAYRYGYTYWTLDWRCFWVPQIKGGKPGKHEGGWYLHPDDGGQRFNDWLCQSLWELESIIRGGGDGACARSAI